MHTIDEINARLAAISQELETATGDALTALETEVGELEQERTALQNEVQARQALRSRIASGTQPGIQTLIPAAPAAPTETVEQQEARAFADYIRGTVAQMRANEQNIDMTNSGSLIPTTIANRIIEAVKERCPIFARADIYRVKGTLKIPVYGPKTVDTDSSTHDITVGYATEFQDLTADSGAFTSVDLTGYLIGALTLISRSAQTNATVDLVSFVVNKMADKIALFVENELLNGTGSSNSHCTGALSTTNTINAGSTSAVSADNLIDLQARVKTVYQRNAIWIMNPATFTAIKKLKKGDGQYLLQADITGEFPYQLLGKPVYLSDAMPAVSSAAKAIFYGDCRGMAVNIRENMSVEVLREKYATQHAIGVVAWMELDSKIQNAEMFATLTMSV